MPDTCFECDAPAEHKHHVIPRVKGGKRTINLCLSCHEKVHDCDMTRPALIKLGMQHARLSGVRLGAPPKFAHLIPEVRRLRAGGKPLRAIAEELDLSLETVWRYSQEPNPNN